VGYNFPGFAIEFAILPRHRAGGCPRAVLVATALDDIPAPAAAHRLDNPNVQ
jgi:hypothetical protein